MNAMQNISYGLFVLTANSGKMNGCIINTLMQVTTQPNQITITVNKSNHSAEMISQTKKFNVSILDQTTDFELIKRFGFASGKTTDKFDGFSDFKIAENGVAYITKSTNAYISAEVTAEVDLGTHIMFFATVTHEEVLGENESLTYADYHKNVKPKKEAPKGVWVCKICGYVYEGDPLPEDFVCPLCKHGVEDFEKRI